MTVSSLRLQLDVYLANWECFLRVLRITIRLWRWRDTRSPAPSLALQERYFSGFSVFVAPRRWNCLLVTERLNNHETNRELNWVLRPASYVIFAGDISAGFYILLLFDHWTFILSLAIRLFGVTRQRRSWMDAPFLVYSLISAGPVFLRVFLSFHLARCLLYHWRWKL